MECFDSLRDYADAMEKQGKLIRIPEMDQDAYEMTAFAYRLDDKMKDEAPAFIVERVKMDGQWFDRPVISNILNSWSTVAQCFGVEDLSGAPGEVYDKMASKILSYQDKDGRWPSIEPKVVEANDAPVKAVRYTGDDVDVTQFPWIKNNPADGGRYISAGCCIMEDPDLGRNVGTYRLMVKGPKKVGICMTWATHGNQYMTRAMERGETSVKVSIAIGADPITWMMSSTRLADTDEDEFALAGGFRGKPLEVVKSESNDLMVPAHAEYIIEGTIPCDDVEEEGPYGELFGYIGDKGFTYYVNIDAITHREKPWNYNLWPGIGGAYLTAPWEVGNFSRLKKMMPALQRLHTPPCTPSIVVASIDKVLPGQGIEAGLFLLGYRGVGIAKKMCIVVDKDVDVCDLDRLMHAVGTRWQPATAHVMVPHSFHIPIEPSTPSGSFTSSKIVIDATRQMESEGGPEEYPEDNRAVMEEKAGDAFRIVDEKWNSYFGK